MDGKPPVPQKINQNLANRPMSAAPTAERAQRLPEFGLGYGNKVKPTDFLRPKSQQSMRNSPMQTLQRGGSLSGISNAPGRNEPNARSNLTMTKIGIQPGTPNSDWLTRLEEFLIHFFLIIFDSSADFSKTLIEIFPPEASAQIEQIFTHLRQADSEMYSKLGYLVSMSEKWLTLWNSETNKKKELLEFVRLYRIGCRQKEYYNIPTHIRLEKLGAFISGLQRISNNIPGLSDQVRAKLQSKEKPISKEAWLNRPPSPRVRPVAHFARVVANILCRRPCDIPICHPCIYGDEITNVFVKTNQSSEKQLSKLTSLKYGMCYNKKDIFCGCCCTDQVPGEPYAEYLRRQLAKNQRNGKGPPGLIMTDACNTKCWLPIYTESYMEMIKADLHAPQDEDEGNRRAHARDIEHSQFEYEYEYEPEFEYEYEYEVEYEYEYEALVDADGQPMIGLDGKPILKLGPDGKPVMRIGPDGKPMRHIKLGPNGKPVYKLGPDGKRIVKLDGNGKPILKLDKHGKPIIRKGPDGQPIVKRDKDGNIVYKKGADGKPVLKLGRNGKPIVKFKDGKPVLKLGPDGKPIPKGHGGAAGSGRKGKAKKDKEPKTAQELEDAKEKKRKKRHRAEARAKLKREEEELRRRVESAVKKHQLVIDLKDGEDAEELRRLFMEWKHSLGKKHEGKAHSKKDKNKKKKKKKGKKKKKKRGRKSKKRKKSKKKKGSKKRKKSSKGSKKSKKSKNMVIHKVLKHKSMLYSSFVELPPVNQSSLPYENASRKKSSKKSMGSSKSKKSKEVKTLLNNSKVVPEVSTQEFAVPGVPNLKGPAQNTQQIYAGPKNLIEEVPGQTTILKSQPTPAPDAQASANPQSVKKAEQGQNSKNQQRKNSTGAGRKDGQDKAQQGKSAQKSKSKSQGQPDKSQGQSKGQPDKSQGLSKGQPDKSQGQSKGQPDKSQGLSKGQPDKSQGKSKGQSDQPQPQGQDQVDEQQGNSSKTSGTQQGKGTPKGQDQAKPQQGNSSQPAGAQKDKGSAQQSKNQNGGDALDQKDDAEEQTMQDEHIARVENFRKSLAAPPLKPGMTPEELQAQIETSSKPEQGPTVVEEKAIGNIQNDIEVVQQSLKSQPPARKSVNPIILRIENPVDGGPPLGSEMTPDVNLEQRLQTPPGSPRRLSDADRVRGGSAEEKQSASVVSQPVQKPGAHKESQKTNKLASPSKHIEFAGVEHHKSSVKTHHSSKSAASKSRIPHGARGSEAKKNQLEPASSSSQIKAGGKAQSGKEAVPTTKILDLQHSLQPLQDVTSNTSVQHSSGNKSGVQTGESTTSVQNQGGRSSVVQPAAGTNQQGRASVEGRGQGEGQMTPEVPAPQLMYEAMQVAKAKYQENVRRAKFPQQLLTPEQEHDFMQHIEAIGIHQERKSMEQSRLHNEILMDRKMILAGMGGKNQYTPRAFAEGLYDQYKRNLQNPPNQQRGGKVTCSKGELLRDKNIDKNRSKHFFRLSQFGSAAKMGSRLALGFFPTLSAGGGRRGVKNKEVVLQSREHILNKIGSVFPMVAWPEGPPLAVRHYPNGEIFCATYANGQGEVYYPFGQLAIVISSPNPYNHVILIRDPYDEGYVIDNAIFAQFDGSGEGTVFSPHGYVSLQYNPVRGYRIEGPEFTTKRWVWNRGGQQMAIKLNRYISLRISDLSRIYVVFNGNKRGVRFNVGLGKSINLMTVESDMDIPYNEMMSIKKPYGYEDTYDYPSGRFNPSFLGRSIKNRYGPDLLDRPVPCCPSCSTVDIDCRQCNCNCCNLDIQCPCVVNRCAV